MQNKGKLTIMKYFRACVGSFLVSMNIDVFYVAIIVNGRISECSDFSQDIRALPVARTATEPAGEIRGGLQE